MLYVLKKRKIEQCHKLLLVLRGNLAQTRSYSRWQVAGCGTLAESIKNLNCQLADNFDPINASVLLLYTTGKIKNWILAWSSSDKLARKGCTTLIHFTGARNVTMVSDNTKWARYRHRNR